MSSSDSPLTPDAWAAMAEGIRIAGEQLASLTGDLEPAEQADGYQALLRALNNQLGRFEVDRDRPELVPFNGWREKMLMDNPDFRYWVADIRDDRRYRITGCVGDAIFQSITAYNASGTIDASATARLDSSSLTLGDNGTFDVTISAEAPDGPGDWLPLPEGASVLWLRQFYGNSASDRIGWCRIDPLDNDGPSPSIDPGRFNHHLGRLRKAMTAFPAVFAAAVRDDVASPNMVRHWSEMVGGAAFTEPDIHYLRGSWQLEPDEALVIEGVPVPCKYWNILLYSRFLNSLDYRTRTVSRTSANASLVEGRYRLILAGRDPESSGDWLDTEGRRFGIFVFRFLQPQNEPDLPSVKICKLDNLAEET